MFRQHRVSNSTTFHNKKEERNVRTLTVDYNVVSVVISFYEALYFFFVLFENQLFNLGDDEILHYSLSSQHGKVTSQFLQRESLKVTKENRNLPT